MPFHNAASMSRTFCAALGIAFEIGWPNRFKRMRIKITTTKTFTILMTEWPMLGAAITFLSTPVVRADSARFPGAVLGTPGPVSDDEADRTCTQSHLYPADLGHNTLRDEAACRIAVGNHRAQRTACIQILTHRDRESRADGSSSHCRPPSRRRWSGASLQLAGYVGGLASDGAYT